MTKTYDIKPHMDVLGQDGAHVGTVDFLDGPGGVVLTKSDASAGGQHHVIPMEWVSEVDDKVHLNKSGADAKKDWKVFNRPFGSV